MNDKMYYVAIFHPEEKGYSISIPDLNGCFTQGDTMDEALKMTKEAIELYLEGEDVYPTPSAIETLQIDNDDFGVIVKFNKKCNK